MGNVPARARRMQMWYTCIMETPLWIIAISQLLVDILIVVLLITLIVAAFCIVRAIRRLSEKAEVVIDNVNEATEYVKESKIGAFFKVLFAPSTSKKFAAKFFKSKSKPKRSKRKRRDDEDSYSW